MKIIDTHQHLWDLDLLPYSWCQDIPALNRSFRMNDYLEAVGDLNVIKSVHLEADVDEPYMLQETQHILALAAQENPLQGLVASCRPEKEGFRGYLDQIACHPRVKGVRRILHRQPDELSQSDLFIQNVRSLSDYGLSFDLCVRASQLSVAANLVRNCPHVSFILDHCGNPLIKEGSVEPWRSQMCEIAALPNVACKISGIVTNADSNSWSAEGLRPYVEHVLECFGWDRVMFGSDWPVCTLAAGFKDWLQALSGITEAAPPEGREKLFWRNADRIYRLN